LNCLKRQLGIKLVNLLDHHVDRLSWLAFLGTILMTLRAFAADESSNKPPPTTLIIAAAADLKFALDDLVKELRRKIQQLKSTLPTVLPVTSSPNLRTARRSICSSRLMSTIHGSLLKRGLEPMRFSFTRSAGSLFGCRRIHRWMWITLVSIRTKWRS
jgi:hypothetical protein